MFSSQNSQVSNDVNYIEDVFNSYLWTTSASDQTLTTGIDMTKGALTWIKSRSNAFSHVLQTGIGGGVLPNNALSSNNTNAYFGGNYRIAESTTGFTMGTDYYTGTPETAVVWTFRKQPKFFDVVTYTGDGSNKTISHSLGSAPGCIIVKRTDTTSNWRVYHRSLSTPNENWMHLNTTDAAFGPAGSNIWNVTSTTFQADTYLGLSTSGGTYVAYLFAHDAGGFGLTGTDNVISCGSFTTDGSSNATIDLGYEPQWVLTKRTNGAGPWGLYDTMRGWSYSAQNYLLANDPGAEGVINATGFKPTATGFTTSSPFDASANYIYIAIRRGPMKVPTSGTSVFAVNATTGNGSGNTLTTNFPVDLSIDKGRTTGPAYWIDRLRGGTQYIDSASTNAELTYASTLINFQSNTSIVDANYGSTINTYVDWAFGRAPSFFDEVCYTGTGSARTVTHNLGVAPEMMITKVRTGSTTSNWAVYHKALGATDALFLDLTDATTSWIAFWNNTAPTSSVFSVGGSSYTNNNGGTLVAYLFATCAGVSKVGSYTGTGTTKQVDCGFTGGARFVLIKRTDSTGGWYVWDSARGIVSGNDSYLLLNSTAAEVTNTDYVDTYSAGFEISSTAPSAINANGGTFIFLAIA